MSRARAVLGICAVGLLLALPLSSAYAGAFSIYEQGARAMGRASAFAACPSDPSAMFYNPAGLALLEGTQIYAGATIIMPSASFEGANAFTGGATVNHDMVKQTFLPPNLYISHRLNDKLVLGLGVHTPFGLGTEWEDPENFTGHALSTKTEILGLAINPTVAFSLSDQFHVGVGVDIRYSWLMLNRYNQQLVPGVGLLDVATAEMETDKTFAFGFNVGAIYQASDQVNIGVAYRHGVDVDYEGTATITQIPTGIPPIDAVVATLVGDHAVETTIAYPAVATVGVAYKISDKVLVEGNLNYTLWSAFDELVVTGLPSGTETIPEDYEDSITFRLGAEFWKDDTMAFRVGYLYDQSPIPAKSISPLLPDANRNGLSAGIGKSFNGITVDVAVMYLMVDDADTDGKHHVGYDGIYKTSALLFGLNVGYAF